MIGIIKKNFPNNPVVITPTQTEVETLIEAGVDIIAADATDRIRPDGRNLKEFFLPIRRKYPDAVFMADCATLEDALRAAELGFDCVGSTLRGYTDGTRETVLPDIGFIRELSSRLDLPVIAEGGIWSPEQLVEAFRAGAWSAVVGSAIMCPMEITMRYTRALEDWRSSRPPEDNP